MSIDDAEFLDRLRALSVSSAHELLAGVDRLRQLRAEWAPVDVGYDREKERARLKDFVYKLAKAEIEHAEQILKLSHDQADLLFGHVRTLVRQSRNKGEPPASVLQLSPVPNRPGCWQGTFEVRNPFTAPAYARFDTEGFRTQQGELTRWEAITVRSATDSVPPEASTSVTITIDLSKEKPASAVYFCALTVYLSADVERQVARRLLRLHVRDEAQQ